MKQQTNTLIDALRNTVEYRAAVVLDDIDAANLLAEIERLRAKVDAFLILENWLRDQPDGTEFFVSTVIDELESIRQTTHKESKS